MSKPILFACVAFILLACFACPVVSLSDENVADITAVGNETGPQTGSSIPQGAEAASTSNQMSLLDLILKGGVVGYGIILLSVLSLALIVDYAFTIRKGRILPSKDILQLQKLLQNPSEAAIEQFAQKEKSFIARVTVAGLRESPQGYPAMIKAMEDEGEALASGIARKTEHLNVIGNIAPMMGLLGTVIGMLRCFNEIAHMTGAIEPKQLAGGIFEALITTCMGLIVAIPALYCYAVFRNRLDEYSGEASLRAERLVSGFKPNPNGIG